MSDRLQSDASLKALFASPAQPVRCKVCGKEDLTRVGAVDFNRTGAEPPQFEPAGVPVPYWQCNACRFAWAPDLDGWDDELFRRFIYNEDYGRVETPENAAGRAANIASRLRHWLAGFPPSTRLLDYGCGPGLLVETMRKSGFQAAGYDRFQPGFQNPPGGTFDVITCFEVLEHVNRIEESVDDILRFLSPQGLLILGTFLVPKPFSLDWWYCAPRSGHVSLWTFESLSAVFHRRKLNVGSDGAMFHFVFSDAAKPIMIRMFGQR